MISKIFISAIIISLIIPGVLAVANFQVSAFSCTPSETTVNEAFTCSAQVQNTGDAPATLGTATLYPDSGDWMENSNYPKTVNDAITAGQSTEVTFTSLKAVKTGSNGFQKISLDDITDTYVSDRSINIIDVSVIVNKTASNAAMGETFDVTGEVTAGGDIDVTLTFTINSGGCSIGSQSSSKTITGMTDGSKQSRAWTSVTQGTSGGCDFTITASATGEGGIATKNDFINSVVACTDCPVASTASSGGGGGGGGGGSSKYQLGKLTEVESVEMSKNEKAQFEILGENHTITLTSLTETTATFKIQSKEQNITLIIGEEKGIDINENEVSDISIKLDTINIITKIVTITIRPLTKEEGAKLTPTTGDETKEETRSSAGEVMREAGEILRKPAVYWSLIVITVIILIVLGLIIIGVIGYKGHKEDIKNKKVKILKRSLFTKKNSIIKTK